MSIEQRYKEIFDKEILQKSRGIIFSFSPLQDQYIYQPYSHGILVDSVEKLGELMRQNLFFYSYGEEEIVQYYEKDYFSSMEQAARFAYRQRLPKRADITDGLPSEVLLDLLVQLYNPQAYKLAVRTIFRQNDNNEIKGYDLTYLSKEESGVSLWLGQAKLGGKDYCKSDINKDLLQKFTAEYLSKQFFFVCDKRVSITNDAKAILKVIEEINIRSMEDNDVLRGQKLLDYFKSEGIRIKIPCLLAYGADTVYKDASAIYRMIEEETISIRDYYNAHTYVFRGFSPEIVFYILTMLNIGFIEEIIFRGFLFKMMEKDNVKTATAVSSITFGIGHIINLCRNGSFYTQSRQTAHKEITIVKLICGYPLGSAHSCGNAKN